MKESSNLDSGLPTNEEDSNSSEFTEIRKQLDKTKKRVKTLVNVIDAQNTLLRRLATKIDPDDCSLYDIRPTTVEVQTAVAPDYLDGRLPEENGKAISVKKRETTSC